MTASWTKESFDLRALRSMLEWVAHISQDPDTKNRLREAGPILRMNVDGPGEEKRRGGTVYEEWARQWVGALQAGEVPVGIQEFAENHPELEPDPPPRWMNVGTLIPYQSKQRMS